MTPRASEPIDIVIAGGGVAGLEALLGLHAQLRDRARLTLVSPDTVFSYWPLSVAEPFALGHADRVLLSRFTDDVGAELITEAVVAVDDKGGLVHLSNRAPRPFDALLLAPGGRAVSGVEGATTWFPGGDSEIYGGLLRDLEEGYAKRLAIVVPPGAVWPLPAYELALMTAGEAEAMGQDDVRITLVTPEHAPLSLLGEEASAAVAEELGNAGIAVKTGVVGRRADGGLLLEPGGERLKVERVFAVPRIVGPAIEGLLQDRDGFILAGDTALVQGATRTWAAGDGVVSPVKFGGLATHQARRAVAAIARVAGIEHGPDPGEPVLHGRLLTGRGSRRLTAPGHAQGAPLWWPTGKIAGEYLPRWLAEHGVPLPSAAEAPIGGLTIKRPLRDMQGAEAQYLFDLARRFDSRDPQMAALGHRMRETEGR